MNTSLKIIAVAGLAALGFAAPAIAQDAMTDGSMGTSLDVPTELTFVSVDIDQSGDITLDEINQVDPEFGADLFAQADVNGDDVLDETEYNVLLDADVLMAPSVG